MDKLDGTPHYHKDEDLELRTRLDKILGHSETMWVKVGPATLLEWTIGENLHILCSHDHD